MILKYNLYIATAAFVGQTSAFTPISPSIVSPSTQSTRIHSLNSDWDNKDFLSSLSGSSDDIQKANEDYNRLASSREVKNEWLAKSMSQPGRQGADGVTRGGPSPEFLAKMGYGQQQQQQSSGSFQPPQQPVQPVQQPPQQQAPPQFYDQFGNPITTMPMVYDANGNLVPFNPQQTQRVPQQTQPPPQTLPQAINVIEPPLPPKSKGETVDHRPVGYNPDAYTMSNTADVYFAQLKQDSKVRKQAWLSGDIERANQVFADQSVKQIGESWVENPYTKEQNVNEARAQIEGAVRMQVLGGKGEERVRSRITYKKKLEEMKAKRGGGGGSGGGGGAVKSVEKKVEPPKAVVNAPPAVMNTPAQVAPAVPKPNVAANPVRPPPPPGLIPVDMSKPGGIPPPPKMMSGPPIPVAAKPTPSASAAVVTAPAATGPQTRATTAYDEEDTRRKVRTLQGLLLKQRGGPGFGAGRLRAPEAQRLESTLEEVKSILRAEAGLSTTPAQSASPAKLVASPEPVMKANPAPNAPAPVIPPPVPTLATNAPDPVAGSIACVEAALKMYKEASPPEREALLIPLREAFMAAAGASNKVIAETELNAHKAAMALSNAQELASQPVAERSAPMMGFPTSYNVAKAEPSMDTTTASKVVEIGSEGNTRTLEDAYNALVDVSGGGKFGLKNISGNEASQLASKLSAMRGVLLDELN